MISNEITDKMLNPLLKRDLTIEYDGNMIDINLLNIGKYFKEVYILCPLKNECINKNIFNIEISIKDWDDVKSKLVLYKSSTKILKNECHFKNISIVDNNTINVFNKFEYELEGDILVIPIIDISFLNIIEYLKL